MLRDDRKLRVFVSSTSEDVAAYRAAARLVILDVGWVPEMMEHMGARPDHTVDACRKLEGQCDLVLLLIAFRRGWVPTVLQGGNGVDSITALELAYAREQNIPVLAMMANDTWPGKLWDEGDARAWLKHFRDNLNQPATFFEWEAAQDAERMPVFRAKVRETLVEHKARLLEKKHEAKATAGLEEYLQSAYDGLMRGTTIPFIGPGVYGTGPLGSEALSRALLGNAYQREEPCVATAAEYRERILRSRDTFLQEFGRIIAQQESKVVPTAAHDLVAAVPDLPLIVDATFDRVLPNRLGDQCVIVSHIVRSAAGEHNGKILVLRPHGEPEICLADKVSLADGERVIYKPLGSPFLHDRLDPDLEIDTVVATETDHVTFLGRLENQHTQIPARIQRLLKRRAVLFLGYGLDVWQYRLVIHVFQAIGTRGPDSPTLAVRVADSPIEEVAWRRLGADVIAMDANEFARRVRPPPGAIGTR